MIAFIARRAVPLGLSLVLIVLSVAGVGLVDRAVAGVEAARVEERVAATAAAGSAIEIWFRDSKAEAGAIAATLQPWTGSNRRANEARAILDRSLRATPRFDLGALMIDRRGLVVASSSSHAGFVGHTRNLPHMVSALSGTPAVSGVVRDPLDQTSQVQTAHPLRDSAATVTGALVLTSALQGGLLHRSLVSLSEELPQGAEISLIAPSGTALIPDTSLPPRDDLPDVDLPADEAQSSPSPGFLRFRGEGGVEKVASFAAVEGWSIVIIQDAEDYFLFGGSPAQRLTAPGPTRAAAIAAALILLILLPLGWGLHRRLVRARMEADEAGRAILAITGHELRTPLTALRGFSQTLSSRWESFPEERRKELVTTMARHARSLEHVVERLIQGAQMEAGIGIAATFRDVVVAEALAPPVAQLRGLATLHEFVTEVPPELSAHANQKALEQVFTHLLENAVKYSPSGGEIRVSAHRTGRWIEIAVEDQGVGLPSDPSRIFEKFGQGEAVDTRTYDEGGVGLGLFIVRRHVETMGGSIRAEARDPAGARFILRLPAAADPSTRGRKPP